MPNRIIRDGILSSERVCSLTWGAEVFYRRLMSVVDDHGRFHSLPKLLRAACYPLQIDKVSDADIGKWLTECVTAALVSVYPASDGKRYIQIEKFGQQVRSKSKFPGPVDGNEVHPPAPDINCYQPLADAHVVVVVDEDVFTEANASGADAPTGPPPDPIWGTGLGFLRRKGIPEKSARALLGKVKQACGDIEAGALLAQAEAEDITDPAPWLMASASKHRARAGPNGATPPPSRTLTAVQTLQAMRHGTVDSTRDSGRAEQAALPEPRAHTGR